MSPVTLQLLRTVNLQHQRIDGVDDRSGDGSDLNGRIPMTPEKFRSKMEEAVFTHRSDAESVIRLQKKIFFEKVTACEHLELEGLPADQMLALAHALPLYKNLKSLTLKTFRCDEEQVEALAEAHWAHWPLSSLDHATFLHSSVCMCRLSRPWKAFATSGLQMITVRNDDAKSTTLMVKAFLGSWVKCNCFIFAYICSQMFSGFQWSGFDGRAHRWMLLFSYVFDILWQWQVWMVWRSCSFIIHLCSRRVVEHVDAVSNCQFLHWFAKFCIREIHMSGSNVMCSPDFSDHDLNGRALDEDASLDLSLFPGLGRGAEDKLVRHEHWFAIQRHWWVPSEFLPSPFRVPSESRSTRSIPRELHSHRASHRFLQFFPGQGTFAVLVILLQIVNHYLRRTVYQWVWV